MDPSRGKLRPIYEQQIAMLLEGKDLGSQLFRNISSNAASDLELDEQTVRGALVYHFWSGGGSYGG